MSKRNEMEKPAHEITWLGRLDGSKENPKTWRGAITARLDVLAVRFNETEARAASTIEDLRQKVNGHYVKAALDAVVRCIDGRGEENTLPDNTKLGPQVPGGTAVTSLAYRFCKGLAPEATIESDVEEYTSLIAGRLPYIPGGHEDQHNADHPENTGCGAIDKMLEVLKVMGEYDTDEAGNRHYLVYDYAKALAAPYMDSGGFEQSFQDIIVKLQALNGPHFNDRYFQKEEASGSHRFRTGMLDKVKEGGKKLGKRTVERLTGEHNEVFLVVNYVSGETFDRDGFAAEKQGKAQAFNYDVWVIAERARDIFPDDPEKQRTLILTNIMYAVGTAMVLTDGSLELGIRQ